MLVTRSAGSDLIVALCKAEQPHTALRVYHDMMASAFGSPGDASTAGMPLVSDKGVKVCTGRSMTLGDGGSTALTQFCQPSVQWQAEVYSHAGHLLPQTSAAEKDTQQDLWSSTSHEQPASAAGSAHATSRNTAHDSSDLANMRLSDARPMLGVVSAGTSMESMEDSHAVSTASDPPTIPEASAVSSPAVLQKPERRTPRFEQLSPEFPSAAGAARGAHQRAVGERLTPVTLESAAASQSPSALPAASLKPPRPAGIHKKQPAVIPHIAALGALVGALARASELDKALQLYKQVSSSAFIGKGAHVICYGL